MAFMLKDLESLKRTGATMEDIHYKVSETIHNAKSCDANLRSLDEGTGRFEIVLTGTLDRKVLERAKALDWSPT